MLEVSKDAYAEINKMKHSDNTGDLMKDRMVAFKVARVLTLLIMRYLLMITHSLRLTNYSLLLTTYCLLFITHTVCVLFITSCSCMKVCVVILKSHK